MGLDWSKDIEYEVTNDVKVDACGKFAAILLHKDAEVVLNGERGFVTGPALICLNGHESVEIHNSDMDIIYFGMRFLCRSVGEELMRQYNYYEIAAQYNLFNLSPFLNAETFEQGVIYVNPHMYGFLLHRFARVRGSVADKDDGRWSCKARSYLMEILAPFDKGTGEGIDKYHQEPDSDVDKIVDYVRCHYQDAISANGIGRQFGQNRSAVFAVFKNETGYTVAQYIERYRVYIAKYILAFTEITVAEVAERVGYKSAATFIRAFERVTDTTPEQYKKQALEARKRDLNNMQISPSK